jgi:hypothetical protein
MALISYKKVIGLSGFAAKEYNLWAVGRKNKSSRTQ